MKRYFLAAVGLGLVGAAVAAACGEAVARYETSFAERPRDPTAKAVAAPRDMKLVLLLGQSNMAGRAPVPEADRGPLARAFKMERDGSWVEATSPIHFDRKFAGMSPCNGFAKAYLAEHPQETLGLVPCAVGGSSMATWIDGGEDPYGQNLRRALERAKKAQSNGTFVAVLWHQGEADATAADYEKRLAAYPERFRTMAWRIRRELGNPDLPVIMGEIGPFWNKVEKGIPAADLMNKVLNAIPGTLPRSACASAKDLSPLPDGQHFDLPSTETLGRRYYEAWKRLAKWGDPWQRGAVELAPSVLTLTNEARYLEWKWRVDVTDRSTGLDAKGMRKVWEAIATNRAPDESWQLAKGRMFAAGCDRASIDVSPLDWFPAFSPWTYHRNHPIRGILNRRARQDDATHDPELGREIWAGAKEGRWTIYKDYSHSSPDWDRILKLGYVGMLGELKRHWKDEPYYQSRLIAAEGILRLLDRLIAQAEKKPKPEAEGRRARLEKEIASLKRLREGPPKTAYDTMMFIYLGWVMGENFDLFQVRTLSNVDRILTPYYRADLAAGRTTEAEFREQLRHFWWQWGSIDNYWGQPVYVGGTRADGSTEYNEVSKIVLDIHDELNLPTPKMHLKMAKNTPDWVWEKGVDMARRQRSVGFCGEEPIRRQMKSLGYTDEEARNCIIWGCYEWGIRESANDTVPVYFNLLKCVEDALADARTNALDAADFPGFKEACLRRLDASVERAYDLAVRTERRIWDVNPSMFFSLSVGNSVKTGKDAFFNGTARGNNSLLLVCGLGTLVDALLATEEIVYGKGGRGGGGGMSLKELGELMAKNWEGHEELRRRMMRSKRKWGTNDAEANALGAEIIRRLAKRVNRRPNGRGGSYRLSGHSARQHIELGRLTGATPDGRLRGEEFSKNLSATMGADSEGVTALISTVKSIDGLDVPGDFPLDVALLPYTVAGAKGLMTMRTVIEEFFANGGVVIQFNVHDVETLRDAQKHPEKYENLQVRVCGWNVRWNDIPKVEQDKFILRAERIQ